MFARGGEGAHDETRRKLPLELFLKKKWRAHCRTDRLYDLLTTTMTTTTWRQFRTRYGVLGPEACVGNRPIGPLYATVCAAKAFRPNVIDSYYIIILIDRFCERKYGKTNCVVNLFVVGIAGVVYFQCLIIFLLLFLWLLIEKRIFTIRLLYMRTTSECVDNKRKKMLFTSIYG